MAWRRIFPVLVGAPLVLAGWGIAMLALTLFQPPGRPVAVFSPGGSMAALAAVIAADGYILEVRGGTVIAISGETGFVPRLYRSGALLVMPADAGGCIVAPPSPAIRSAAALGERA